MVLFQSPSSFTDSVCVYREMEGWKCDTTRVRKIADLPENAKKYLRLIEEYTGVKVAYAGVGPDRDSIATL